MATNKPTNNSRRSIKHDIIDSANTKMLIAVSVGVFVVVFCLFAGRTLFSQSLYQQKIISKKQDTLKVLKNSRAEAEQLQTSYLAFETEPINLLGGNPTGSGPKDGDNAKLVLDSLPYELDFPGLSSSVEKILLDGGYTIQSIGGDDTGSTTDTTESTEVISSESSPVEIPFPFSISTSTESALTLLQTLENSIRPFHVTNLQIEAGGNGLELLIDMKTYYKPSVGLNVSEEVVK